MFGSPYAIFLLREHFRIIPNDLINAARLDGANTLDVIVHVVIPSSRPVLAALTLITVVSQWNNFMWPLVITSGHKWRVLTVATADLQSRFNSQWTLVMAATTVAIVAADRAVRGLPASHRRVDRRLGAQVSRSRTEIAGRTMTRPRFSTLVAGALALVAVLLACDRGAAGLFRPAPGRQDRRDGAGLGRTDRRGLSAVVRGIQPRASRYRRCTPTWSRIRPTSTRCAPTSPAAAPTTSSGSPTPTSPPTPTAAG